MKNQGVSITKNITIPEKDFEMIERYTKKVGKTFSEFLRYAAKEYIKMQENLELKEFLLENCDFATLEEENDILEIIKDFDPGDRGRKISSDEIRDILPKKG